MSFKVEKLPSEPIIIETISAGHDMKTEATVARDQVLKIFDQQTEPVYFIIDLRAAKMSLDDVMAGSSLVNSSMHMFRHPKIRCLIMVTTNRMITLAARGLDTPVFGSIHMEVFGSMEDALTFARRK